VRGTLKEGFASRQGNLRPVRGRMAESTMLRRMMEGLALCHNVNVTLDGGQEEYQVGGEERVKACGVVKSLRDGGFLRDGGKGKKRRGLLEERRSGGEGGCSRRGGSPTKYSPGQVGRCRACRHVRQGWSV